MASDAPPASFWRDLLHEIARHPIGRMSAALAFYGLFAIPPILVFALVVAGRIFGTSEAREGLLEQISVAAGDQGRVVAEEVLDSMPRPGTGAPVTQLLGAVALFFAATAGFKQLEGCLNQIMGRISRRRGFRLLVSSGKRILGFFFVVVFSVALLALASMGVALQLSPESWFESIPGNLRPFFEALPQRGGLLLVAFLGMTFIYKVMPDRGPPWKAASIAGLLVAIVLLLLKGAVALYLRYSWRNVAFGAAGSVVGLLISFYAAAMVVLLGAVVATVWTRRHRAAASDARV